LAQFLAQSAGVCGIALTPLHPPQPFEERRVLLREHYGFDCRCARCVHEQRRDLKARIRNR